MEAANSARSLPHFDYRVPSPHYIEREREVSQSNQSSRPYTEQQGRCAVARPGGRPTQRATAKSTIASTPYATHSRRTSWFEEQEQASKPRREISGRRPCIMVPTMVFGGKEAPRFASPHNGPFVVEMKIVSAIVRRILIDTGSSVDIITWDCLKKLAHPGRDIIPLVHPILGFGGQEVNPASMIRLPMRFGDKLKSKNLEVDFLVVDVPMAYNVILGCPTLHKILVYKHNANNIISPPKLKSKYLSVEKTVITAPRNKKKVAY
ncbi:hypothetical protein Cgig2_009497 [Carnegiea gigantea]|uniref:Peptidase A2 domain-containing protein n=1 Tax=Carnegiea gigantea TaxID=171969 RepID=A0A9Q1GQS4_9CARY|nr:hypothetical protein Cgig2_009497 [Carnegiea gigantea]